MQDRNDQDQAEEITRRLQTLADEHSLTTIARRTGTPPASMHRYLNGARIPADFCARLSREFQVNPVWLINGEGSRDIADVSQGTQQLAGNVLELVNAMSAVAHMRLGALAGKHHLKVLRELNDSLLRYEGLRKKLNANTQPVFRDLLDQLEKALKKRDFERAFELREAVIQVERLCDTPELTNRMDMLLAHCAVAELDVDSSLQYLQRHVRDQLVNAEILSDENCESFLRLALSMYANGKTRAALRLCNAAVELADDTRESWASFAALQFFRGHIMANTGELYAGLSLMQQYRERTQNARLPAQRRMIGQAMLMAGLLTLDEAYHYSEDNEIKATYLLEFADWQGDTEAMTRALEFYDTKLDEQRMPVMHAMFTRAFVAPGKNALTRFETEMQRQLPHELEIPDYNSCRARILLAAGDKPGARKIVQQVDAYITDEGVRPDVTVMVLARHYRNVVECGMRGEISRRAGDFFRELAAKGYRCLEPRDA